MAGTSLSSSEVLLSTVDGDLGIVAGSAALKIARDAANELNTAVTIRDLLTDKVYCTVAPQRR